MKPIRFRIRRLMTWVAVIAINLAILRALIASWGIDLLGGFALPWIALEIGAFRAFRSRGPARAYWLGFLGCGTAAAMSLPASMRLPESIPWKAWMGYFDIGVGLLDRIGLLVDRSIGGNAMGELTIVILMGAWGFFPIVLAAWAGGLLTRRILESSGRRPGLADGPLSPY